MSLVPNLGAICTAMPQFIEDLSGGASPYSKRNKLGAIDFLLSDLNTAGSMAVGVDQMNGKRRAVDVYYMNRATENDVVTQRPTYCDFDAEGYLTESFDIGLYAGLGFQVNEMYMAEICEGDGAHFAKLLLSKFDALNTKMDKAAFAALLAGAGTNVFSGNSNEITHDLLAADGSIKADVLQQFLSEIQLSNLMHTTPGIIGAGSAWKAAQLLKIGCCNGGGIDIMGLAQQAGFAVFADTSATSVLGNVDSTLVVEPGSAKLATWYRYRDLAQDVLKSDGALSAFQLADGSMRGIVRDPITGIPYNIKVIKDSCGDKFNVLLDVFFDVWTTPADLYDAADPLSGYTGILKYKFT